LPGKTSLPNAAPQIALPWIVRLRYGMVSGQIATVFFVRYFLGVDLPLAQLSVGPALVAISNALLASRASGTVPNGGTPTSTLVAWAFALDTVCLTWVLSLSGGPTNPFTLLYLVHITLSATILTKRSTWLLGALSVICFGLLFLGYKPIPALEMHHAPGAIGLHLVGMWASFGVAALLVAMFSGKISELLRQHEESLLRMQEELAKKDRLASLVTLAAGAAHELSTPLSTIAVIAKELESFATNRFPNASVAEDSRLIRSEVDRCGDILRRMSTQGAAPAGEAMETLAAEELLARVNDELARPARLSIESAEQGGFAALRIPLRPVQQALIALVKNALEASAVDTLVRVSARQSGGVMRFVVSDEGPGMPDHVLRRIGEPFFTTKEPGKGMGLGTFLVRTLAEDLGGSLRYESAPDSGTSAILELPVAVTPEGR
jgi:two-component system sensor histidine kinase RegB